MIVNKVVVLNNIEPSLLSFRAPMGMDVRLNVSFFGQDGTPYSSDLASQLQLTGRSSARTQTYLLPATDIVNGRARATIPSGDLDDANGWRLRLVGTLNGEASLLALGTVMPIAAAGLEAVPEDTIDAIDLAMVYDNDCTFTVKVWQDAGKSVPYDLAAVTVGASVYESRGGPTLQSFAVTNVTSNMVTLSMPLAQVNTLPPSCWWSLTVSSATGVTTLAEGAVTISGVPPP